MAKSIAKRIELGDVDQRILFGQNGVFLDLIKKTFDVAAVDRGEILTLTGEEAKVSQAERTVREMISHVKKHNQISERNVLYSISVAKGRETNLTNEEEGQSLATSVVTREGIKPRTSGQAEYVRSLDAFDIVIAIGPAGTGKTFLAVASAVAALKQRRVNRIVLCRPAIEAGESLGFLPGDIRAKVDPYLRPVYDALHEMVAPEKIAKLIELGTIEILPLAFMRGRTLNNSYVILDEGQNTTSAQMKMFLTRLGESSKAVVTGDITQIDLENKKQSGLILAQSVLKGIEGIKFVFLTERDVVRHKLVSDIISAYERFENKPKRPRK